MCVYESWSYKSVVRHWLFQGFLVADLLVAAKQVFLHTHKGIRDVPVCILTFHKKPNKTPNNVN